jgi:hypothetical protein
MNQKGYIAIISAVVISFLIMGVALTLSFTGFFNRSNISNSEFKKMSNSLAEACASTALFKIAENKDYLGNESVTVDNNTCSIMTIESLGEQKIIKTTATVQNSTTNLKVTIDKTTLQIASWEEVPTF